MRPGSLAWQAARAQPTAATDASWPGAPTPSPSASLRPRDGPAASGTGDHRTRGPLEGPSFASGFGVASLGYHAAKAGLASRRPRAALLVRPLISGRRLPNEQPQPGSR